ncbi:Ubiquitin-protein ligase E3A [Papilio machaon]|uniref:HECT-type E3 ubiquitin transferase n=1 Tax=Papilio machaon TaxID=76193 RepID=A0A194RSP6_PAPMA|nr:Ubiquitin-protein ligase E3A [Papilio machaon]
MNSKSETDEASRGREASSSNNNSTPNNIAEEQSQPVLCLNPVSGSTQDIMKRAAKELIERYFYQLLEGCGNPNCDNEYCASSQKAKKLTANEAAAVAIKLAEKKEALLCDRHPNKVPRTDTNNCDSNSSTCETSNKKVKKTSSNQKTDTLSENKEQEDSQGKETANESSPIIKQQTECKDIKSTNSGPLTEERMRELCDECLQSQSAQKLLWALGSAFRQPHVLAQSFRRQISENESKPESDVKKDKESKAMCSSSDPDKDIDSVTGPEFDAASCHRAFLYLAKVPSKHYNSVLVSALETLALHLKIDLEISKKISMEDVVNCFVIAFEIPDIGCSDYLEVALPTLCHAVEYLPIKVLQQLITLRVVSTNYSRIYQVQDDECVTKATKLMKIVYYANMLAGEVEQNPQQEEAVVITNQLDPLGDALHDLLPLSSMKTSKQSLPEDPLAVELKINSLDVRKPYLPFEEFYNEPLSDSIEMDIDFASYKTDVNSATKFAFLNYPFILTAATKSLGLYYENRIRMYSERRVSLLHAVVGAAPPMPFLRLRVRRSHIIADALVELEMIAMERALDLKKQLMVEFEGEQGVDEGGVSKEFFQLIVEEIFNPDYGMFTQQPDSHTVWSLEMIAMERALDLKKQLMVEFEGEQGVDEGGVSKEFFQLIVEEIFNPDYGMFTQQPDSHTVWFNPTSFETEAQFTLIGIVLGLAIYNNIILAVNFPMVVYRKLMGRKGSFEDLADWNPSLYNGLKDMLDYCGDDLEEVYYQTFRICYKDVFGNNLFHDLKDEGDSLFSLYNGLKDMLDYCGDDLEEVYYQTFRICYKDVFGNNLFHDLKDEGDSLFVTQANKREFVDLYADFLLNKSVETQFRAFRRGFVMVTDESPLSALFRPEEIETLVCGSKNFDFNELEKSTEYDGGYTAESRIIKDFWCIVHNLCIVEKRKLLQFTTGSDRVPVGGLSYLKLVIARNGPDSDRLPTAHTCFNVLLLPEYESRDKLRDRLMKAISYSKGFGML